MRVLEQKPVLTQTMGKKKHKYRKHSKENANFPTDSSDESHQGASGPRCSHVSKSINISSLRKALKQLGSLSQCTSCSRETTTTTWRSRDGAEDTVVVKTGSQEDLALDTAEPTLWVCLQCGHIGCDRNSKEKHGLTHFQTPRSASHAVVVNTSTWIVWCYSCEDECPTENSRKLQECVDLLRRLASGEMSYQAAGGRKGSVAKQDIAVTVGEMAGEVMLTDEKEKTKAQNKNKSVASNPFSGIPLPKVYGLSNLGNTCFFNAVMQNLSHTYIFRDLLNEYADRGLNVCLSSQERLQAESDSTGSSEWSDEDPVDKSVMDSLNLTLPECGALTKSMIGFLGEMKLGHDTLRAAANNIVNPDRLFGQICKKTPRFKGFQQQDSHELLRHLLEGMKGEEIRRSQGAILKAFNLENGHHKRLDDDTKSKIKEYGRQVKHTFVDSVFGGYFISTVLCEECHMPSQVFEPFQDISLPILEEKPTRPNNLGGGRKRPDSMHTTDSKSPEESQPHIGVDGFAAANRPSKYISRKVKKQAQKEARKKAKNQRQKPAVAEEGTSKSGDENAKETELEAGEEVETEDGIQEACKSGESKNGSRPDRKEQSGSNEDWDSKSDADVEDNVESDVSRKHASTTEVQHSEEPAGTGDQCAGCQRERAAGTPAEACAVGSGAGDACVTVIGNAEDMGRTGEPPPLLAPAPPSKSCGDALADLEDGLRGLTVVDVSEGGKRAAEGHCMMNGTLEEEQTELVSSPAGEGRHLEERKEAASAKSPKLSNTPRPIMNRRERQKELKLRAMQTLAPRNQPAAHECSVMSCLNQFTAGELLMGNNKFGCERCTRRKYRNHDSEGKRETVYTNASKQLQIFIPPAVLTLHLKRFQQVGFSLRKVNRHVDFPLQLDLGSYCSALSLGVRAGQTSIVYSLYGVVEHSGRLSGGHYTAYVKVRSSNSQLAKSFLQFHDINGLKLHKVLDMMKRRSHYIHEKQKDEAAADPGDGKWYYMSDTRVSETSESNVLRCQAYLLFYERIH